MNVTYTNYNEIFPPGFVILEADATCNKTYQIVAKRTVVGWYNVYLIDEGEQIAWINVSPSRFKEIFTGASEQSRLACDMIAYTQVWDIFGEQLSDELYVRENKLTGAI
ncbi:hypothetical protein [Paraliobacillus salinarum]|uniref:hypothetical protein n=1 Tax=Paraliobacillus salinarum TaxID=1158996 RepID=UPI0015F52FA4|nr:hypothetical protein [Paraliobacillus salinarum]